MSNLQLDPENPSADVPVTSNEHSPLLSGLNAVTENNNEASRIELNGILPTTTHDVGEVKEETQMTNNIHSNVKKTPPALDLSKAPFIPQR